MNPRNRDGASRSRISCKIANCSLPETALKLFVVNWGGLRPSPAPQTSLTNAGYFELGNLRILCILEKSGE